MPHLHFGGHDWQLLADHALFWPKRQALIVADLHFEKASWFALSGQYLPPFDSVATLSRLTTLVKQHDAQELWCLGDNFHDDAGPARLSEEARILLAQLAAATQIIWITGNHDDGAQFIGESHIEATVDGVVLRHEARPGELRPELSGHFHPKVKVQTAVRHITRPCFVHSGNHLILPAFGALTGGLDIGHPVLSVLHGGRGQALLAANNRLLAIPLPAPATATCVGKRNKAQRQRV
jgi:uncharacterized protein